MCLDQKFWPRKIVHLFFFFTTTLQTSKCFLYCTDFWPESPHYNLRHPPLRHTHNNTCRWGEKNVLTKQTAYWMEIWTKSKSKTLSPSAQYSKSKRLFLQKTSRLFSSSDTTFLTLFCTPSKLWTFLPSNTFPIFAHHSSQFSQQYPYVLLPHLQLYWHPNPLNLQRQIFSRHRLAVLGQGWNNLLLIFFFSFPFR